MILKAMAGTRQRESLLVLLENETKYREGLEVQMVSEGKATERYTEYLESAEAAQNRMNTAVERFWQKGMSSGVISGFYDFIAGVVNLITDLGGLKTVLLAVTAALIYFNSATIAGQISGFISGVQTLLSIFPILIAQIKAGTVAQWAMNVAMEANPIGLVIVAIGALVGAYAGLSYIIETTNEKLEKQNELYLESKDAFDAAKSNADKMRELAEALKEAEVKSKDWYAIQNEMKKLLPEISGYYDDMGNFIITESTAVEDLTKKTNDLLKVKREEMGLEAEKRISLEIDAMNEQIAKTKILGFLIENNLVEPIRNFLDFILKVSSAIPGLTNLLNSLDARKAITNSFNPEKWIEEIRGVSEETINSIREDFSTLITDEDKKEQLKVLRGMGQDWATQLADELEAGMKEVLPDKAGDAGKESGKEFSDSFWGELSDDENKLIDTVVKMIETKKKLEKESLQDELDALKELNDAQKDYYKEEYESIKRNSDKRKEELQRQLEDQKRIFEEKKDAIEEELEAYERIIDAEKERLQLEKKESDHKDSMAEKQTELAKIQQKIAELSGDTSESGIAQRLQLEQEAAELEKEIAKEQSDYEYDLQIAALDAEQEAAQQSAELQLSELEKAQEEYERKHELLLRELEDEEYAAQRSYEIYVKNLDDQYAAQKAALEAQIKSIDDYLAQDGTLRRDAMEMIKNDSANTYAKLLEWNQMYGTGINDDIISMWDLAMQKVNQYAQAVQAIPTPSLFGTGDDDLGNGIIATGTGTLGTNDDSESSWWDSLVSSLGNILPFHDGMKSGFVGGGAKSQSNEQFAKLLNGEAVLTPDQMDKFMTRTLPSLVNGSPSGVSNISNGGVSAPISINVAGNLDSSVIPSIEKVVNSALEKINKSMMNRGLNRPAKSFSI